MLNIWYTYDSLNSISSLSSPAHFHRTRFVRIVQGKCAHTLTRRRRSHIPLCFICFCIHTAYRWLHYSPTILKAKCLVLYNIYMNWKTFSFSPLVLLVPYFIQEVCDDDDASTNIDARLNFNIMYMRYYLKLHLSICVRAWGHWGGSPFSYCIQWKKCIRTIQTYSHHTFRDMSN